MKMKYERPVMRAEAFQTNAYCGDCNRLPGPTEEHTILKAVSKYCASLGRNPRLELYFDMDTRVDGLSDSHGLGQHYYHEYTGTDFVGNNGTDFWDFGNTTYYLEWSARDRAYYVYQENPDSGYSDILYGDTDGGENKLQINGRGPEGDGRNRENGGWNLHYDNESYYRADKSVTYGTSWTVTYENGTKVEYTASY